MSGCVLAGSKIAFLTSAVLLVGGSLLMPLQDLRDHLIEDDDEEDEPAPRRPAPARGGGEGAGRESNPHHNLDREYATITPPALASRGT